MVAKHIPSNYDMKDSLQLCIHVVVCSVGVFWDTLWYYYWIRYIDVCTSKFAPKYSPKRIQLLNPTRFYLGNPKRFKYFNLQHNAHQVWQRVLGFKLRSQVQNRTPAAVMNHNYTINLWNLSTRYFFQDTKVIRQNYHVKWYKKI